MPTCFGNHRTSLAGGVHVATDAGTIPAGDFERDDVTLIRYPFALSEVEARVTLKPLDFAQGEWAGWIDVPAWIDRCRIIGL